MAATLSRSEILGKVYKMVPPMLEKFHKGTHTNYCEPNDASANPTSKVNWEESPSSVAVKTTRELHISPQWHRRNSAATWYEL